MRNHYSLQLDHLNAPLSKEIKKQYTFLIDAVLSIPRPDTGKKVIIFNKECVSVRDILAYQIGWITQLLSWYQEGLQRKIPDMPGDGFTIWKYNEIAHHFFKKYQKHNLEEQLKLLHTLVQDIIIITEKEFYTGTLDILGHWTWCALKSGKQWPLSKWITINTVSPFKRAITLLKKVIKS